MSRNRFIAVAHTWRAALALSVVAAGCRSVTPSATTTPGLAASVRLVPAPASIGISSGEPFVVTANTRIVVDLGNADATRTGEMLAAVLRPSTGFPVPVSTQGSAAGGIAMRLVPDRASLGDEGYDLEATRDSVRITAYRPAGLFRATQTLRQLLPPSVESHTQISRVPWTIPLVRISDQPRYAWRGAMLDVARHFFTVKEVKQYIDLLAMYKLNVLHMHLSDDQGWRIEIKSHPELTTVGGSTQVGGGPGGFFTQAEYADIVRYAQDRYVLIVPEIDMPAHTNAALSAFPALSCGKRPAGLYTGTEVGFSSFCVDKEETYALIDDIVREIAALTPGPFFHMGGDEVEALTHAQYVLFVERVQDIVAKNGKQLIGWEEIGKARLRPTTLVQPWRSDSLSAPLHAGGKVVLSPAGKTYLDMKYDASTELGLRWAALIEVRDAYDWDPASFVKGVTERDVMGVEAPLWSETIRNITAAQYLAMPRLPTLAEVAWTPQSLRQWSDFRERLAAQAPRWNFLGINFHRSPQVPW